MDREAAKTLAEMPSGSSCYVLKIHGYGGFRKHILELGFVKGTIINVIKNAPLLDPIEYEIMGSHVSLRRSEAKNIEVIDTEDESLKKIMYNGTAEETVAYRINKLRKEITVALVGNPNCGKTSFFNYATGLREKTGNYAGVTVETKVGVFYYNGYTINLVDLPGTYSLTEYSPEELYVRNYIIDHHPDLILNIVDASNLERNLYLTSELIDMSQRIVMALNMYDEFESSGNKIDYNSLSKMLGFPIVPTVSKRGEGIDHVLQKIIDVYEEVNGIIKHIHINYGKELESSIQKVKNLIVKNKEVVDRYHGRFIALKLIENDHVYHDEMVKYSNYEEIKKTADVERKKLETSYNEDIVEIITDLRYGFIRGALRETFTEANEDQREKPYSIDKILTNKWLGFPILFIFLWIMFQATFTLGAYPQAWIENGVAWLGDKCADCLPEGFINSLIVDGIIAGVGGVLVFLPNILIMFLFISFLEDSGYMARAAFIMDKLMHNMGLHGKSFIPYLIGFGCGVPAIMATRTLESTRDRIITALTIPFMSCSARLPLYILFVSAFFTENQGLVLMSIYLIGIIVAILSSLLLSNTVFKNESDQFVMELPPYRIPTFRNVLLHLWTKTAMYLKKIGTVILLASVIIWILGYFPRPEKGMEVSEQMENSYIGRIGHTLEPVVKPLGFDWKMGVSIISGFAAKEIVVSTLGVLYQNDTNTDEGSQSLINTIKNRTDETGERLFTPLIAYGFMLFVLLYFPCVAVISTIWKEIGWKWAVFEMIYTTSVAWIVSFGFFQTGSLLV